MRAAPTPPSMKRRLWRPLAVLLLACTSGGAGGSGAGSKSVVDKSGDVEVAALLQLSLSDSLSGSADTVRIEPWGANSLRVRVALDGRPIRAGVGALIKPGSDNKAAAAVRASPVAVDEAAATITNGNIAATVGADGLISVSRVSDSTIILRELSRRTARNVSLDGNPPYDQTSVTFAAKMTDKVFGMGQHSHGQLDNKNVVQVAYNHAKPMLLKNWTNVSYDFQQCLVYRGGASDNGLGGNAGGSVCIPWTVTAAAASAAAVPRGSGGGPKFALSHGFLWNMPNYGTVSFWDTNTTWMAEAATQLDWFITVPPALTQPSEAGAAIMHAYVDAVGHAPVMPTWGMGYWHSRNRYSSQDMLLAAAKGFHDRGVPVSVIVIDYMHWVAMGDFSFDPKSWPDIPAMMRTLTSYGMRVMVSAWPFLSKGSGDHRAHLVNHSMAMTVQASCAPVACTATWTSSSSFSRMFLSSTSPHTRRVPCSTSWPY